MPARAGWTLAAVAAMITIAGAACGGGSGSSSPSSSGPASCPPRPSGAQATTASYTITLDVGPVENMYSQQQVDSSHPTSGEVMLGGVMSMASGANARHLEAHICAKASDTVVSNVNPTITMTDTTTAGSAPQSVPISVMQGVTSGASDLHYGNNIDVTPGHSYSVTITVNGETATIPLTAQ